MKNLRLLGFAIGVFGGGTLILKLVNRPPSLLQFLGEALVPVAIAMASLGAVFFIISFIKLKKKEGNSSKTGKNNT